MNDLSAYRLSNDEAKAGGYQEIRIVKDDIRHLAAFIATRDEDSRYIITDAYDNVVCSTIGSFLGDWFDSPGKYRSLLAVLQDFQLGRTKIPTYDFPERTAKVTHKQKQANRDLEL